MAILKLENSVFVCFDIETQQFSNTSARPNLARPSVCEIAVSSCDDEIILFGCVLLFIGIAKSRSITIGTWSVIIWKWYAIIGQQQQQQKRRW